MRNILLIMPYGSVGGMERLALTFYNHYKSKGYQVKALKFIKMESDIINFGEDELFFKPYDFVKMSKVERALFYFKAPFLIRKIIRKHNITDSIAFGDMANLFSSLSFTKEFKVGSIHALKSVEFSNPTFFNKIFKKSYRTSYKYLDKVVCISKAIKQDLIENCQYKFSNLEIIYNPHNIDEIVKRSKEVIDDQKELEVFSKPVILFLGRMSVQKSPWHLIRAFSLVLKKNPDTNLVFIGDGDGRVVDHIEGLIKQFDLQNNVFLLGRRSNPYKYLAAAKVLVLSSHYEGTPNVIVESIGVGTPIVSSYCTKGIIELMSSSDHPESDQNIKTESGIVTPNLFKGILGVPETDQWISEEEKLAEGLSLVLTDDNYKTDLKKFRSDLLSKFDLENVAKTYIEKTKTA
ncbi:glycosyltransferase [Aquimarina sp. 2201CG5-10]|uniref:glycosyltransferase n=1 Tax=Aquimarina callyspongiae TaxID=3098150 RepID=UPI002AB39043|nr:glycosyltransferase [Aquimarina sp. 2201CG5-10]MDY8136295.1 glycosyltransferase [Aquimarina sp. 2201CG5-10]